MKLTVSDLCAFDFKKVGLSLEVDDSSKNCVDLAPSGSIFVWMTLPAQREIMDGHQQVG